MTVLRVMDLLRIKKKRYNDLIIFVGSHLTFFASHLKVS